MEEPQLEPELQGSPPRRVRRRGTHGCGTVFAQFFLIPIFALAIAFPLWTVHSVVVRVFGPVVPCRIVDRYREYDHETDSWRYYLRYTATVGGRPIAGRELMDRDRVQATPIGSTRQLRLSPLFPGFDSVLLIPGRNLWGIVWLLGIVSFFMGSGAAVLAWYIYVLPARRRRLVVSGFAVAGRLTDKTKFIGSKSRSYTLHYEYRPLIGVSPLTLSALDGAASDSAATPLYGRQDVRAAEWDAAQIGECYTVLYDPRKPAFSLLYRFGDYLAVV